MIVNIFPMLMHPPHLISVMCSLVKSPAIFENVPVGEIFNDTFKKYHPPLSWHSVQGTCWISSPLSTFWDGFSISYVKQVDGTRVCCLKLSKDVFMGKIRWFHFGVGSCDICWLPSTVLGKTYKPLADLCKWETEKYL